MLERIYHPDQKFLFKTLEVKDNLPIFQRGLFAAEDIRSAEKIFSFYGQFVSREDASDFTLQIDKDVFLETDASTEYENCINHACFTETHKPNCEIRFHFSRPTDQKLFGQFSLPGEVVLMVRADIAKGDQLFFDYATTEANMDDPEEGQTCSFDCACGLNCRGHISGFANLTEIEAKRLYPYMSPFIQSLSRQKFKLSL